MHRTKPTAEEKERVKRALLAEIEEVGWGRGNVDRMKALSDEYAEMLRHTSPSADDPDA